MGFDSPEEVRRWYERAFREEVIDCDKLRKALSESRKHPEKNKTALASPSPSYPVFSSCSSSTS